MRQSLVFRVATTFICFFLAVLFLLPTMLTITNSFMKESEIYSNYGMVFSSDSTSYISQSIRIKLIPDMVTLKQYVTGLINSPDYLLKFWNSFFMVVPIVVFQLIVASLAAYSFTRWNTPAKKRLFFLYIILMLMPYQVTLVPNFLVSKWLGILNKKIAVILPGIFSPFSVFLITKNMKRVPYVLIEAAKLDGASEIAVFTKIMLPLSKGAIISAGILVFIDNWNMVEQPLVLLSDVEKFPLSITLSSINQHEIGIAFALATVYMVLPLLIFLKGEEHLVEGIISSAGMKG